MPCPPDGERSKRSSSAENSRALIIVTEGAFYQANDRVLDYFRGNELTQLAGRLGCDVHRAFVTHSSILFNSKFRGARRQVDGEVVIRYNTSLKGGKRLV